MKQIDDYLPELKNKIQKDTGYKISEKTLKKIIKYFFLNMSYELKDMKQINLEQMKLIPTNDSLKKYYKLYPFQDLLKISRLFKRRSIIARRKRLDLIRKEFPGC